MDLKSAIQELLNEAAKENAIINKELRHLPSGTLQIWKQDGYTRFVQSYKRKQQVWRKGIGKNKALIYGLARKTYLKALQRRERHNVEVLKNIQKDLLPVETDAILADLPKHFSVLPEEAFFGLFKGDIHPSEDLFLPLQEIALWLEYETPEEWGIKPYRVNSFHSEEKRIIMPDGLPVRSKSEAAIIERYRHFGIPFHYDELLTAEGRRISPDLRGARRDGKLIWHEHFGLMDDPVYRRKADEKLEFLKSLGIVPWDNMIVTYERPEGGINIRLVDELLKDMYMFRS